MGGLAVWHHQGLMLSELNYFFKSKHCKAVEPCVFHSWPRAGYRAGVPGSEVLPGKDSPLSSGVLLCPGLRRPGCGLCQQRSSVWCHAVPARLAQVCELFPPQPLSLLSSATDGNCDELPGTCSRLPPGTASCCVLRTTALSPSWPFPISAPMGPGALGWLGMHPFLEQKAQV